MKIDIDIKENKQTLLSYFRGRAHEAIAEADREYSNSEFKKKAAYVNKALSESRDNLLSIVENKAKSEHWMTVDLLECALMIYYTNDVVMLETRNLIWEYDYMAFSRRIGELWEPFCKLCFKYPLTEISFFLPPLFYEVKQHLSDEIKNYIDHLTITKNKKIQLLKYYDKVWALVTSGEIKLECDLHFIKNGTKYIVDFKSGFGSNEKGNTNRLLLVGTIYHNIDDENYKCMLFVRSAENNHYLTTLSSSGVWDTYTGENTYRQIEECSGYNLHKWITTNIDWMNDFSTSMRKTVLDQDLEKYLIW